MKTIKLMSAILLAAILFTAAVCCFSAESGGSVYASPEDREYVYDCALKDSFDLHNMMVNEGLSIVKESITPVFRFDLLEYAETGKLSITPYEISSEGADAAQRYAAKVINAENEFAGNLTLYVDGGIAHSLGFVHAAAQNERYGCASCSYADHAERIASLLGLEEPIPPEDVKYLSVVWIGECFYVQKNGKEYLVPIGTAGAEDGETAVITENDLRSIAGEYRAYYEDLLKQKAEWEKEHPGEEYSPINGGQLPSWKELLSSSDKTTKAEGVPAKKTGFKALPWVIAAAGTAAITAGAALIIGKAKTKGHAK